MASFSCVSLPHSHPTSQSTKRMDTEDFRYTEVYFLAVPLPLHLCQCFKFEIVEFKPSLDVFI